MVTGEHDYFQSPSKGFRSEDVLELQDVLKRLAELGSWIADRGIDYRPTRVGHYARVLSEFISRGDDTPPTQPETDRVLHTLREVYELLWIHRGLLKREPPGYLEVLGRVVRGPAFAKDETKNTEARNFQLELRIASYFLQTGFEIDLRTDADLQVGLPNSTLHVECKRLNSQTRVIANAKIASKQLRARYGRRGRHFGLAVLDVSRILWPNQGLGSGLGTRIARDGLRQQLIEFVEGRDLRAPFANDKRLLNIWVQTVAPIYDQEKNEATTRFSSIHLVTARDRGPQAEAFNDLRRVFDFGM